MDFACVAFRVLLFCTLSSTVLGQALPDLPDLPSPSPAPSQSPLPSALAELVNPSPSPIQPTAVPPGASPGAPAATGAVPPPGSTEPSPEPSQSTQAVATGSPSPSPSVSSFLDENGNCIRDESQPRPTLGKSQLRYAVSVLLSAAAVALASVCYGLASDWEPEEVHAVYRLIWITLARILIVGAVKVSAALVASITKASPDDGALDASGAFLTWGSAIFTRLYYEGFKMTMAVLEFTDNNTVWDDKLRDFLSVRRTSPNQKSSEENPGESDDEDLYVDGDRGVTDYLQGKLSVLQRLTGGNLERKLLLVTTVLYFASEISVLSANVLVLVGAFLQNADPNHTNFFAAEEDGHECFSSSDIPRSLNRLFSLFLPHHNTHQSMVQTQPLADICLLSLFSLSSRTSRILCLLCFQTVFGGLISLQVIYAFSQQPSLVPLLTLSAYCPQCEKYPGFNKILKHLRWVACFILCLWVTSLLVMPVFAGPLQPVFLAGDISLFWYVIVAPPSYKSASYIITATFTCLAAIVGTYVILGISKSQRTEDLPEPQT